MIFPPFISAEVVMARALMPADHHVRPEPMTPERAARALYAKGHRALAAHGSDRQLAIDIVRAFGPETRFGDALNSGAAMQAVRYHLQRLCDQAIANPFDPEHIAALKAEARNCARPIAHVRRAESEAAE